MPAMLAAVAAMAEEVQQGTSQKNQEGRHLEQMSTVFHDEPPNCCRQTEPEKPLVDAGPVRPMLWGVLDVVLIH